MDKIKKLTLTSWDSKEEQAPLKIAVFDNRSNSPFTLAFFRGHYQVAWAILEIVQAQYSPEEKVKARYRARHGGGTDSEEEDDSDEDSEMDEPDIEREVINDRLTIDNIGEVSMRVKSHVLPLQVFNWMCSELRDDGTQGSNSTPISLVIKKNDLKGLKFLLDIAEHFSAQKDDPEADGAGFFSFPSNSFTTAVELGRTEILAEIIRRTGAGLPLEDLVKDAGVETKPESKYYQGLTVYGKKRYDHPS